MTPTSAYCAEHRYESQRVHGRFASKTAVPYHPPTEAQISAFLSNRERDPADVLERQRAVAELAELERTVRFWGIRFAPKRVYGAVS